MLHFNRRPHASPSIALLALLGLASPTLAAAASPQEGAPEASAPQVDIDPPPTIQNTSSMDAELVALLAERIAAVTKDPASVEARVALGFVYESNTMWSLAEVCYDQALALAPEDHQWRFRRGVVRYALGKVDPAIEDLRTTAEAYKNTPVVQARLGDVLRLVGELEESEAAWRQAIAAEANQPQKIEYAPSRVGLAQVLIDLGEYEEAEALCRRALELQPGYKQAHYTLGIALRDQGRDAEAEPELILGETSFQMFPPDPHQQQLAASTRGFSRRMMLIENMIQAGQLGDAKSRLDEILVERPADHMVLNLASRVALRGGDLAGAREMLTKSLEASPGEPSTLIDACLLELRESEQVVAQLGQMQMAQQQGQALDQARFEALRAQGSAAATKAVEYATQAARAAPAVGRHHYWLGVSQQSLAGFATDGQTQGQQFQAALSSMQNAAKLGCTEPGFNQQIATLYARVGRPREMLMHTERHLAANPRNPGALQMMVENSIRAGSPEGIEPYMERLRAAAPGDPGAAQFAVKVYLTIKDVDRAEAALSDFEAAAAGNPQAAPFITAAQSAIATERAAQAAAKSAEEAAEQGDQSTQKGDDGQQA